MSRYDADDVYCIPGTAVLKNKAGITDQDQLDEYEGDFTAIRLLELTQNPVEGSFDLAHLCKIHQYLFQDVYEWAGEVRTVDIIRGDKFGQKSNADNETNYPRIVRSLRLALGSLEKEAAEKIACKNAMHWFFIENK